MKKIVFTGGGTLGHVMTNIYLIEDLQKEYKCYYIGGSGIEKEKIKNKVERYFEIKTVKLIRGKFFQNFKIPFVLISAIKEAKKTLKKIKPDLVFSKGGYVALPVCIAAKMLRIPVIAHESDSSFGLANKIILKLCNKMCVNFKDLCCKNKKIIYTGPIFSNIFNNENKDFANLSIIKTKPTILVVGGSLGSKNINKSIYIILDDLLKSFNVIHITGKGNNQIKSYQNYNSFEMVDNIVNLYNIADFVIGRSGAGVTAECFYKQLPMLLIPLQNKSTRGDQVFNAEYYHKLGVAEILKEIDLTPELLLKKINLFNSNLNKYKNKYQNIENKNGKEKLLEIIKKTL